MGTLKPVGIEQVKLTTAQAPALAHARFFEGPRHSVVAVFPSTELLAQYGGELLLARAAEKKVKSPKSLTVALSGGQTPDTMFDWLSKQIVPPEIDFFFVDERFVPSDARDSNYRKAHELFFHPARVNEVRTHRYRTEYPADEAASKYETELRNFFRLGQPTDFPQFDLIYLGMGEDGHTASLFPGSSSIFESRRVSIVTTNPHNHQTRLTFTLPVLKHAKETVVMAQGAKKAAMIAHAFQDLTTVPDSERVPIDYVQCAPGCLVWALDAEAAARVLR